MSWETRALAQHHVAGSIVPGEWLRCDAGKLVIYPWTGYTITQPERTSDPG